MKAHVLHGRENKWDSGRHTASAYFDAATNHIQLAGTMVVNRFRSLAKVGVCTLCVSLPGQADSPLIFDSQKKTLFVDKQVVNSAATSSVSKWSAQTVEEACVPAIKASFMDAGSTTTLKDGTYSVKSPFGRIQYLYACNQAELLSGKYRADEYTTGAEMLSPD